MAPSFRPRSSPWNELDDRQPVYFLRPDIVPCCNDEVIESRVERYVRGFLFALGFRMVHFVQCELDLIHRRDAGRAAMHPNPVRRAHEWNRELVHDVVVLIVGPPPAEVGQEVDSFLVRLKTAIASPQLSFPCILAVAEFALK